jgi:4-hydroxy-tetrahydrodipicolinate synthase
MFELDLRGVICASVTPFDARGEVDEPMMRRHLESQLAAGIDGLMVIGGSGEFVSLSDTERRRVVEVAVEQVGRRVPVIVAVLSPGTREVVELARHAATAGADAVLVLPPYYINPSPLGIDEHFSTVADRSGLPIVVYNNPSRTKVSLDATVLARLVEIEAVVALKDCDRDVSSISEKIRAVGDRIAILSGDDDLAFPTLALGARGGIWAGVNVAPAPYIELYRAVSAGHLDRGRAIHDRLAPFIASWYTADHPAPLKGAMALAGRPVGPARGPLQATSPEQLDRVRRALDSLNVASNLGEPG